MISINTPNYPNITPDLKQWLEQQSIIRTPQELWDSMLSSGWNKEASAIAIELVLKVKVDPNLIFEEPVAFTQAVAVPSPSLENSPLYLFAGDKKVTVLTVVKNPNIVVLGDFLTHEECDLLVEYAKPRMQRSHTVDTKTGGPEVNDVRTSNGMFFNPHENEIVERIEKRIASLVNWPVEKGEGLQVLQYLPGAEYKPHYDFFDPAMASTANILKRGGQRVGTLIMYLHEPEQGGGTIFPDIALEVAPRKGNAVFFSYDKPHASTKTLHGGSPVIEGQKWVATKWLRERHFN